MSEANKMLVRRITELVWNSGGVYRIPEFYSSDYVVDYRPFAPLREGYDAIRGMVERAWSAFPDYHEELHELVAEGDLLVARVTISENHKVCCAGSLQPGSESSSKRS